LWLQEEEPPLPPADRFSPEFIDFIRQTLIKDPAQRPNATELLRHPFVANCQPAIEARLGRTALPPTVDESQINPGTWEDLREIVRKVQKYRYEAAKAKGQKKLPAIPPA
jgi:serine/threonine protein kinase